jgi:hypothetical protein
MDGALSESVREPSDVRAPRDLVTLLNVVQGEQFVVAMAQVIRPEVDAGAIGSGAQHQVLHSLGHPDLLIPWHGGCIVSSVVIVAASDILRSPIISSCRY